MPNPVSFCYDQGPRLYSPYKEAADRLHHLLPMIVPLVASCTYLHTHPRTRIRITVLPSLPPPTASRCFPVPTFSLPLHPTPPLLVTFFPRLSFSPRFVVPRPLFDFVFPQLAVVHLCIPVLGKLLDRTRSSNAIFTPTLIKKFNSSLVLYMPPYNYIVLSHGSAFIIIYHSLPC